jgi:hypothetical protein
VSCGEFRAEVEVLEACVGVNDEWPTAAFFLPLGATTLSSKDRIRGGSSGLCKIAFRKSIVSLGDLRMMV